MRDGGRLPVTAAGVSRRARRAGGRARDGRGEATKSSSRRRFRASGPTRLRRSAATCASGSGSCPRPKAGRPSTSSTASACQTRGATSAASPSRSRSTGASCCAAPSTSSSRSDGSEELRITDHKTGRNRTTPRTVIGGGATLQPVIYGLAVEKLLGSPVSGGRLFYCTAAGGFTDHPVPLSEANRRAGLEALEIIDRAIELGLPAARPGGAGLHVVRLPPGLRTRRAAARCAASRPTRSPT